MTDAFEFSKVPSPPEFHYMRRDDLDKLIEGAKIGPQSISTLAIIGSGQGEIYFKEVGRSLRLMDLPTSSQPPEPIITRYMIDRGFEISRPVRYSGLVAILPTNFSTAEPSNDNLYAVFSSTVSSYKAPVPKERNRFKAVPIMGLGKEVERLKKQYPQLADPGKDLSLTNVSLGAIAAYRRRLIDSSKLKKLT